jgi:hypothetical protein
MALAPGAGLRRSLGAPLSGGSAQTGEGNAMSMHRRFVAWWRRVLVLSDEAMDREEQRWRQELHRLQQQRAAREAINTGVDAAIGQAWRGPPA